MLLATLLAMLDHLTAGLGAIATALGASLHVSVVGELLARLPTLVTCLDARVQCRAHQRALAGTQLGADAADLRTVGTHPHGAGVLLLAVAHKLGTVLRARLALVHAVRARLGARSTVRVRRVRR